MSIHDIRPVNVEFVSSEQRFVVNKFSAYYSDIAYIFVKFVDGGKQKLMDWIEHTIMMNFSFLGLIFSDLRGLQCKYHTEP